MTREVKYPSALAATFIWIGFVGAISFMEAWLKFRAPGISLSLGLGIGRIVFDALNKVELILAAIILISFIRNKSDLIKFPNLIIFIPISILLLQTFWMLPALDVRAELHIQNLPIPPSRLHFLYIGAEFIKMIALFSFGVNLFQSISNKTN